MNSNKNLISTVLPTQDFQNLKNLKRERTNENVSSLESETMEKRRIDKNRSVSFYLHKIIKILKT